MNSISEGGEDADSVRVRVSPGFPRYHRRVAGFLTSREEPVRVLDDGLDDADDLKGNRGHHLRDVAAADTEETETFTLMEGH